ncbi:uncharacterized protein [Diabrotica undecimpunctata]|uniref:uncharacterized protein n=1 Tax=Diabrotica undecimpunctata TaxID=50387 RepID=UPI003B640BF4
MGSSQENIIKVLQESDQLNQAVGSLLFISTTSRLDITFEVHQVSRFFHAWSGEHKKAVKRFRYLKYTAHYKMMYRKTKQIKIIRYTDADNVFKLDNGLEEPKKQNIVAQSTTEAEYVSLDFGVRETMV